MSEAPPSELPSVGICIGQCGSRRVLDQRRSSTSVPHACKFLKVCFFFPAVDPPWSVKRRKHTTIVNKIELVTNNRENEFLHFRGKSKNVVKIAEQNAFLYCLQSLMFDFKSFKLPGWRPTCFSDDLTPVYFPKVESADSLLLSCYVSYQSYKTIVFLEWISLGPFFLFQYIQPVHHLWRAQSAQSETSHSQDNAALSCCEPMMLVGTRNV